VPGTPRSYWKNGRVLVAGGAGNRQIFSSAEIYDPVTGTWASAGSMTNARWSSVAFLLPEGNVLIAGRGCLEPGECQVYPDTEIYDPSSNTWTLGPSMNRGRFAPAAVTLASGKWLVAGGADWAGAGHTSEVYGAGSWTLSGSASAPSRRTRHCFACRRACVGVRRIRELRSLVRADPGHGGTVR